MVSYTRAGARFEHDCKVEALFQGYAICMFRAHSSNIRVIEENDDDSDAAAPAPAGERDRRELSPRLDALQQDRAQPEPPGARMAADAAAAAPAPALAVPPVSMEGCCSQQEIAHFMKATLSALRPGQMSDQTDVT